MPIFDAASLHTAVTSALASADVGSDTNAFVAVVTRDRLGQVGVTGVLAMKLDDHWTLASAFAIDQARHIEGGIEIKATWK